MDLMGRVAFHLRFYSLLELLRLTLEPLGLLPDPSIKGTNLFPFSRLPTHQKDYKNTISSHDLIKINHAISTLFSSLCKFINQDMPCSPRPCLNIKLAPPYTHKHKRKEHMYKGFSLTPKDHWTEKGQEESMYLGTSM